MFSKKYSQLLFVLIMGFLMSLLMTLIITLVNTGMDKTGNRFPLDKTRACIKQAINGEYTTNDIEWTNPIQPCKVGTIQLKELVGV